MAANRLRIGFVGVGNMGQCAHLKNYAALPDCEVAALAEPRPELAQKVAARYGVPKVYKNHADMLANEKLDALVASQQFAHHAALIPELLKARIPIFIEKPLASTIQGAEKILAALRQSGSFIMVGYHKRSDPATACARTEILRLKQTAELGNLRYVRILMPAGDWIAAGFNDLIKTSDPRPPLESDPRPPDMNDETFKLYIAFVNYYIHQVNLMRWLLAEPYAVTYAEPSQVLLVVRSQSGVTGTIEMTPYETTIDWQESALVCFQKGYVKLELPAPLASNRPGSVEFLRDPGQGTVPQLIRPHLPWVHAMRQQAVNFLRAVRREAPPPCSAEEALEDLKVARDYIRLLKGA